MSTAVANNPPAGGAWRLAGGGAVPDVEVKGLSADTRSLEPGCVFAALPGSKADGRRFVPQALARGAVAVLAGDESLGLDAQGRPLILADDPRRALALGAAALHPGQPAFTAAVTGTNGKTSIAGFARQFWALAGMAAANLGTLGLEAPDGLAASLQAPPLTTPDPVALHKVVAGLAAAGVDRLALEASSHGLDQRRLDGLRVDAAAFSNLSRDHFDYHGSFEAYLAAKARLFDTLLKPGGTAVLNADAPEFERLKEVCRARGIEVMDYGKNAKCLKLLGQRPLLAGQMLHLDLLDKSISIEVPLYGAFQAHNVLAAVGLALEGDLELARVERLLPKLKGVRGRMERVCAHPCGAVAFVDYAHTPDALTTALEAARPHADGRLLAVVGAGGDRDPGKRPLMGKAACDAADAVFVTDDNPRSEDPAAIRAQVLEGCDAKAVDAGERAAAIGRAWDELRAGDLLVVAGKGHETGQTVQGVVHPFDDAEVLRGLAGRASAGGRT